MAAVLMRRASNVKRHHFLPTGRLLRRFTPRNDMNVYFSNRQHRRQPVDTDENAMANLARAAQARKT
jgi:hypothetical protein